MTGADVAQNELGLSARGIKVGVMDTVSTTTTPRSAVLRDGCRVSRVRLRRRPLQRVRHPGGAAPASGRRSRRLQRPRHARRRHRRRERHGQRLGSKASPPRDVRRLPRLRLAGRRPRHHARRDGDGAADGMDVFNMSIGDAFAWTRAAAEAMNSAVDRGLVVVVSTGEQRHERPLLPGSAGNARQVIGVASVDNGTSSWRPSRRARDRSIRLHAAAARRPRRRRAACR